MTKYQTPEDMIEEIIALRKRVEVLEKTNPLNNGTVDEGNLIIENGGSISLNGGFLLSLNPATKEATVVYQGQVLLYKNLELTPYALLSVINDGDNANTLRIAAPADGGYDVDTFLTLSGVSDDGEFANAKLRSAGAVDIEAFEAVGVHGNTDVQVEAVDDLNMFANDRIQMFASEVVIDGTDISVIDLPTTGNAPNLYVDGTGRVFRSV